MQKLLLAPHNDDEILFSCYTLLTERPTVLIASLSKRQGENAYTRMLESKAACNFVGVKCLFSPTFDNELKVEDLVELLKQLSPMVIYTPSVEGGHIDHDVCGCAAKIYSELSGAVLIPYMTYKYDKDNHAYKTKGKEVKYDNQMFEIKKKALEFYQSQITRPQTAEFFTNNIEKEYYE